MKTVLVGIATVAQASVLSTFLDFESKRQQTLALDSEAHQTRDHLGLDAGSQEAVVGRS